MYVFNVQKCVLGYMLTYFISIKRLLSMRSSIATVTVDLYI